ncbi:MAG: exodeoxyribonuclease V subunit alpha, partial [Marmoricola sp.]
DGPVGAVGGEARMSQMLSAVDPRVAQGAPSALADLNARGLFRAADVHVAEALCRLAASSAPLEAASDEALVLLAVALAVHAVRGGSVCVDLATVAETSFELERPQGSDEAQVLAPGDWEWPEADQWVAAVAASPLIAQQVLRLEGSRLYLDRYWRDEGQVVADLLARLDSTDPEVDVAVLARGVERVFPTAGYDEQRAAVDLAARQRTTVLTGGPGTGKTTATAGLLALLIEQDQIVHGRTPRIALTAPTARAAARLQEAIAESSAQLSAEDRGRLGALTASTLHRLLGWRPDSGVRFKHNRHRTLPYDIVVVDEASMVSLTLMARLLEALRPQTRLILLGDPGQLVSVEAGAVLADLVEGFRGRADSPVVELSTVHRFGGGIGDLAAALRAADADGVISVLRSGLDDVEWVDPADESAMAAVRDSARRWALGLRAAAESGDGAAAVAALHQHRLLCAHREGRYGAEGWNRIVEQLVAESIGGPDYRDWFPGRPVLVTANDRGLGIYNGDLGVAVREGDSRLRVHFPTPGGTRALTTSRLPAQQTAYAMTVHKAQGSQAEEISVILPPAESALSTRALFYTAVTRAQRKVRVVGSEQAVRAAVGREAQRATGLAQRLVTSSDRTRPTDPPPA